MARRRKHYRGIVSLPSLQGMNPLGKSVNSTDVLVGAAIGVVGGLLVKKGLGMAKLLDKPGFISSNVAPISAVGAGLAAYALEKKGKPGRAMGHLLGAVVVAALPFVEGLSQKIPGLHEYADYGLIGDDRSMGDYGLVADDQSMGMLEDDVQESLAALVSLDV